MKPTLILLLLVAPVLAQDSKPAKSEKPASAPAARPSEAKILGRKVTLSLPGDWKETDSKSTFALDWWEHGKSWKHPKIEGFTVHVYGATAKDLTTATLTKKWLDSAGKARPELLVTVNGKSRQMSGTDTEVELDENGSISYYWLRAIGGAKDRVFVLLAEASPLNHDFFEDVVLAAGPILDSFLDPAGKDPWRRDPAVTVTRGTLVTQLTVPAGWKYTRLAPEGSLIWMGPENGQEIILAYPEKSLSAIGPGGAEFKLPPEQIYKILVQLDEQMAKTGKLISTAAIPGHDQAKEIVSASALSGSPMWTRRRFFLDGGNIISLLAKYPLKDTESLPPDPAQKQAAAVMDSIKFVVKPAN